MRKLYSTFLLIALMAAVTLFAVRLFSTLSGGTGKHGLIVSRVIDGDTVVLSNGEHVRLIGIDTPELHFSKKLLRDARRTKSDLRTIQRTGERSKVFTSRLCLRKRVQLEYDVERRDRYGRLLAYLFLEDGTFLNAEIIKEGYAQVMTFPPNVKYADRFLRLEQEARARRKGLWRE